MHPICCILFLSILVACMTLNVFSVLYNKLCHILFDLFWVVIFEESFTYLFLSIHLYFHLFWVV